MRLNNLSLSNYRKYDYEEITFPDGLIGIIGSNGAGKSTLMESIAWVLYGHPAARTQKEQIKRQNSSGQDVCQAVLLFELKGTSYQITRQMKGKDFTSNASVFAGKTKMAEGAKASLEFITELLGMDREAFFASFFAEQKELNTLSDLTPAERKNLIIRMLGIDNIDKAIVLTRQNIRNISAQTELLRNSIKDTNQLEIELKQSRDKEKEFKSNLKIKIKEKDSLKTQIQSLKNTYGEEEEKSKIYHGLIKDYELIKRDLLNTENNLNKKLEEQNRNKIFKEKIKALEPFLEKYEQTKTELGKQEELKNKQKIIEGSNNQLAEQTKAKELNEKKLNELKEALAKLKEIEESKKSLESNFEKLTEKRENLLTKYERLKSSIENLKEKQDKLKSQHKEIENLGQESKCPTCYRVLGEDSRKIKAHFEEEIKSISLQIKENLKDKENVETIGKKVGQEIPVLKEKLKNNRKEEQSIKIKQKEFELIVSRNEEINKEISQIKTTLEKEKTGPYNPDGHQKIKKEFEDISLKRDRFLKINAALENSSLTEKEIEELKKSVEVFKQTLKDSEKKETDLNFKEENFNKIKSEYEIKQKELHKIELETNELKHQSEISNILSQNLKKEIEENKEKQKQVKSLTLEQQQIDKLQNIFDGFKKHLIGRIRPALSDKISQLFSQLTDSKYSQMELDENYEIFIFDEGEKFPIDRFSGGEKDLANLCLRLAISQLITESASSDFGFIVLDEIFGSQDAVRKNNIMKALSKLSNQFRQIFLITHIDDIKDSMEYAINVYEDENGISHAMLE
ncbi:MAG: SMC family ATPase [Actinobacteria bacterium]|nr:SMC family ATPase [Actinomycetota bacterium]